MVDSYDVSLSSSFIRKEKLELDEARTERNVVTIYHSCLTKHVIVFLILHQISVEIQWMTRPAAPQALLDLVKCGCTSGCSTQRCRCAIAKSILTEMKLSLHKLRESVTPVNTIRCTRWPSDWWWPMTSYCIVLYFFNSSAGKSQLIIPLYSIITCSTTFNHIFVHLYINLYIITCQSSASSHIIIK